jgi:hypothetical protein
MTAMERLELLERQQAQLAQQLAELAISCARLSGMLASVLGAIAEQAEALPGERPLDQSTRARN